MPERGGRALVNPAGSEESDTENFSAVKAAPFDVKAGIAEFFASMLFVIIGCGAATDYGAATPLTKLILAFAFGMSIMCLAYATAHLSGGQINGAVTWSLVLGGELPVVQGVVNLLMQLAGSVVGAVILSQIVTCEMDATASLGSNVINKDYGVSHALFGEILGTFMLCLVVYEVAVSTASGAGPNACLAIGFAVFLAHLLLLPIDGCSINPTRSFGPAVVATYIRPCEATGTDPMSDLWVMWLGPLIGGTIASGVKMAFKPRDGR